MIDDRIIGPYFTLEHAATNSYCFIFIGRITNMCQPLGRGLGADIREAEKWRGVIAAAPIKRLFYANRVINAA